MQRYCFFVEELFVMRDLFINHHVKRILAWMAIDSFIILGGYTVAFFARAITTTLDYMNSFGFILFAIIVTVIVNYLFGVYHRIWSRSSGHEVAQIVFAVGASTLLIGAVDVLLAWDTVLARPLPLSVVVLGAALNLTGLVGARYRSRLISGLNWRWQAIWTGKLPGGSKRKSAPMVPVLIVGAGEAGQNFVWRLKHRWNADRNHHVIGFVDDDPTKRGLYIEGVRVLGGRADIPRLVEKHNVELIVLAIHNVSGPDFREVLAYCESTAARIKVVPDTLAMMNARRGVPLLRDVRPEDILGRKPLGRHENVDLSPITGRIVMVTGAAGSIGSELSRQLLSYNPVMLLVLDNNESGLHDLRIELQAKAPGTVIVPLLVDVRNQRRLKAIFTRYKPQVIFHAAAYKHVPMLQLFPSEAVEVNVGGTRNVARLARDFGTERFVLVSTDKAVDPSNVMGATKRLAELLMHAFAQDGSHDTLFTSVRFGNVFGSRGSVVPTFERQINQGGPVTVTHKDMRRYFMTIAEAVNLVLHAGCLTRGDDLFMLRMGEEVRIVDLAERMIRLRGLRPYEDIPIEFTGMRPGEKLNEMLQLESEIAIKTAHSHIVQLKNRQGSSFRPAFLLEQVQDLLDAVAPADPDVDALFDDGEAEGTALLMLRQCIGQTYGEDTEDAFRPAAVKGFKPPVELPPYGWLPPAAAEASGPH
jgi:FlaA1/EpsC-like NDP-sugar epimerase